VHNLQRIGVVWVVRFLTCAGSGCRLRLDISRAVFECIASEELVSGDVPLFVILLVEFVQVDNGYREV